MALSFPSWSGAPAPETIAAVFRVVKNGSEIDKIKLGKANLVFGRKPDMCDIVLDHPTISRRHAAILHKGETGEMYMMDLGSAQGTSVNQKPVKANEVILLAQGDKVQFGQSTRTFTLEMNLKGALELDLVKSDLPTEFGGKVKAPMSSIPRSTETTARQRRQAEIEAMTASLSAPITHTAPSSLGAAAEEDEEKEVASSSMTLGKKRGIGSASRRDEVVTAQPSGESSMMIQPASLEELARSLKVPVSHEVILAGHEKAVYSLAIDPAGGRIISGGLDYKIKFWDFGGMDKGHRSFREIEPQAGYCVYGLSFSPSGDRFLAATSSVQPAVFDREGQELLRFVRGDMYLSDSNLAKGHTHPVTSACWHPNEKDECLTGSTDGTVRTWDLNGPTALEGRLVCASIFKVKSQRGTRIGATSCVYDPDGDHVAVGSQDGQVQLWSPRRGAQGAGRPDGVIRGAHGGSEVTCVVYASSGRQVASRGNDDTVKVWDVRKTSEPLLTFTGVESLFQTSNISFSPDGRFLVAGTSVRKGQGTGTLKFFDVLNQQSSTPAAATSGMPPPPSTPLFEIGVAPGASVIQCLWHPELNQILCGTSTGDIKLLYDPLTSKKGALLSAGRQARKNHGSSDVMDPSQVVGEIINPHALPMYKDPKHVKRRRGEDEVRPGELRKPGMPSNGPETQTQATSKARENFTEMFLKGRLQHHNIKDQVNERRSGSKWWAKLSAFILNPC